MYSLVFTNSFKKALKKCVERGCDKEIFKTAAEILKEKGKLPAEYKPHKLHGKYKGFWECHLQPRLAPGLDTKQEGTDTHLHPHGLSRRIVLEL